MFELEIDAKTSYGLKPEDYQVLAEQTEGYSGADISIVSRCAVAESFKETAFATHFRKVCIEGGARWVPCSPGDPGAEEKTWADIRPEVFLEVASLKMSHFSEAIAAIQPSTSEVTTRKFEEWTSNFGDFLSFARQGCVRERETEMFVRVQWGMKSPVCVGGLGSKYKEVCG